MTLLACLKEKERKYHENRIERNRRALFHMKNMRERMKDGEKQAYI